MNFKVFQISYALGSGTRLSPVAPDDFTKACRACLLSGRAVKVYSVPSRVSSAEKNFRFSFHVPRETGTIVSNYETLRTDQIMRRIQAQLECEGCSTNLENHSFDNSVPYTYLLTASILV